MPRIDLNSDVGESFGSWSLPDAQMLSTVSSANIACGFHAGDPMRIRQTVEEAVANDVVIGAHIGYRDLEGFGRRFIDYEPEQLKAEALYQLGALQGIASVAGSQVQYVKPHGALYNAIVHHKGQAHAVVDAVASYNEATGKNLPVLLLPGSYALDYARRIGLRGVAEAFADRSYNPDGTLVSRAEPDAVIHQPEQVVENMLRLAEERVLIARDGTRIQTEAESICTHGDTAGAAQMARTLRQALERAGVQIRSFTA